MRCRPSAIGFGKLSALLARIATFSVDLTVFIFRTFRQILSMGDGGFKAAAECGSFSNANPILVLCALCILCGKSDRKSEIRIFAAREFKKDTRRVGWVRFASDVWSGELAIPPVELMELMNPPLRLDGSSCSSCLWGRIIEDQSLPLMTRVTPSFMSSSPKFRR